MKNREKLAKKLYVDDGPPPKNGNWDSATTAKNAIKFLENNLVEHLSLDYDLGDDQIERARNGDGGDITLWLARDENKIHRPYFVRLHSANADGRFFMRDMLSKAGYVEIINMTEFILPVSREEWLANSKVINYKLF